MYLFSIELRSAASLLKVLEGHSVGIFTPSEALSLAKVAPHHARYILEFCDAEAGLDTEAPMPYPSTEGDNVGDLAVISVDSYLTFSEYGHSKDYEELDGGSGFVEPTSSGLTAAIHTHCDARFIALLEFKPGVPRGDHYHHLKVEYMTVLRGTLRCHFAPVDNPTDVSEVVLTAGQMVRILPRCIHTYTALGSTVPALEFAPQRYTANDTIVLENPFGL